jgi:hypothetical protein
MQERRDAGLTFRIVGRQGQQHADPPHPVALLLRPRRERPCRRRAAEQRDELAAFYLIELHSVPVRQGRVAGYRIGEDQSGGNGTILQPVIRCAFSPMSELGRCCSLTPGLDVKLSTTFPCRATVLSE